MRARNFAIGFLSALVVFSLINLCSYYRMPMYSTMDDGFVDFGWPFKIYVYGGFWGHAEILWTGLFADGLIAILASVAAGCLFGRMLTRRKHPVTAR